MRIGILTVSDRSAHGERADQSGPALTQAVTAHGWQVVRQAILPDEMADLCELLVEWADSGQIDIILTTGGTGFSPRDVTPEATIAVIQRCAWSDRSYACCQPENHPTCHALKSHSRSAQQDSDRQPAWQPKGCP
jgi:molybdenum cofactor synthesis domain-containing protein